MAIQMRRGNNEYYNAAKMESGEFASVSNTQKLYHSFTAGTAKEVAMMDDVEALVSEKIAGIEIPQPVVSHTELTERDAEDQHPIEAIRGLRAELDEQRIIATATGESIVLTDSSDKPLEGLVLYGKTTQDGIPSPTNLIPLVNAGGSGELNVQMCGKNLLPKNASNQTVNGVTFTVNTDGSITVNGTATAQASVWMGDCTLKAGVKYIISGGTGNGAFIYAVKGQKTFTTTVEYTVNADVVETFSLIVPSGKTVSNVTYYPMIRLADISDNTYEPYKAPQTLTIQTPNGLLGVPVSSGGNYTDENGQQWVCDEIDFERGVYVQRIGNVDYSDGATVAPLRSVTGTSGKYRFNIAVDAKMPAAASEVMPLFCNITSAVSSNHTWLCQEGVANSNSSNGLWLYLDVLSTKTSDEALAWLRENQVKIQYIRTAPVETSLPAEEIATYKALRTNKPVTTILNDSGAGMSVSYVADTKTYIDNKFTALEAAILSIGGNI